MPKSDPVAILMDTEHTIPLQTGVSTVIAPGNERRRAVLIGAPSSGALYIRFRQPAANGVGLLILPGQAPLYLTEAHIGAALREQIEAFATAAGQIAYVLDVFVP